MIGKNAKQKALTQQTFARIAAEFRALADPTRLQILNELRRGERNVTQIIASIGVKQSNVSKHLALLHKAGFLARRKTGLQVFYSICDPTVGELCELMCAKFSDHFSGGGHRRKRSPS